MNKAKLTVISFLSYALTGSLVTVTGMVMKDIANYFHLPVSDMSSTFTFLNAGMLVAIFLNVWLMDIIKLKTQLIAGFIIMILAVLGLAASHNLVLFSICMFVLGVIGGVTMSIGTFLITHMYDGRKRGSALLFTDSFFSMASMIFPFICSAILTHQLSWVWVYAAIGVLFFVIFILTLLSQFPILGKKSIKSVSSNEDAAPVVKEKWGISVVFLCIAALCYILGQLGFISWVPNYVQERFHLDLGTSGQLVSSFWLSYMIGMWIFSVIVRFIDLQRILVILTILATIVMFIFTSHSTPHYLMVFILLLGFFSSAIYTSIISLGSLQTRVTSPRLVNFILTCGTVGTMLTFVVTSPIVKHFSTHAALYTACGLYFVVFIMCILVGFTSKHRLYKH